MYQTDCPFEVSTTNRYTITNYEAAVTARKRMKQGETIKYLTGTLVPLSTEESRDLDITNRNSVSLSMLARRVIRCSLDLQGSPTTTVLQTVVSS